MIFGQRKIICLVFVLAAIFVAELFAQEATTVRILVLKEASSVILAVPGEFDIKDVKLNKVLYQGKGLEAKVSAALEGIAFAGIDVFAPGAVVSSPGLLDILLNGRSYKGALRFIKISPQAFLVVNYVDIEEYIKGVLYHEGSHYWPIEALKAQAIACRTFALSQVKQDSRREYDLTSDIYSQVYGGKTSERYRTNMAVSETAGMVLEYQSAIFPAYYHSTCGGYTEDASLLWDINIPPLDGVTCPFCRESPHFSWRTVLPEGIFRNKLKAAGFILEGIKEISVLDTDTSERINKLKIAAAGKSIKISAKDLRNILGPNSIKSTRFSVKIEQDEIIFTGIGWGHGVGMCQWGAYFMAKQGYNATEILEYYYPQAEIARIN